MNWQAVSFDWNQARAFLVTAEEGSLSAAARALGLTQPTLGRQVAALETALGVTLFERAGRSLSLTPSGLGLLDHVRSMGDAANLVSLTASGQSQAIEGNVSVTATGVMSTYFLPDILKRIRHELPGITIDVIASNDLRDLTRREADIAIRHGRPTQPTLIAKLIRQTTAHLYASTDYLDRLGRPEHPSDLSQADFIGFESVGQSQSYLNHFGLNLTERNFKLASNSGLVILELVKQGLGVSILSKEMEHLAPNIECVLPDLDSIPVPIWLVTHRELHSSRRIRLVFDLLADALL